MFTAVSYRQCLQLPHLRCGGNWPGLTTGATNNRIGAFEFAMQVLLFLSTSLLLLGRRVVSARRAVATSRWTSSPPCTARSPRPSNRVPRWSHLDRRIAPRCSPMVLQTTASAVRISPPSAPSWQTVDGIEHKYPPAIRLLASPSLHCTATSPHLSTAIHQLQLNTRYDPTLPPPGHAANIAGSTASPQCNSPPSSSP